MPYEYCTYIFVLKLHSTGLFYVIYLTSMMMLTIYTPIIYHEL